MTDVGALATLLLTLLLVAVWVADKIRAWREPDEVEQLQQQRVDGEITQDEFERRLDVVLDEEAQRIQESVEPVPGIGPRTSSHIAEQYDTVDELRKASVDELQDDVAGVGEKRATAIKERLDS
jgi:ERCC4-type nuclease